MAKFYVQSAEVKFVVTAADGEGAALWMINQFINQSLPQPNNTENRIDEDNFSFACSLMDHLDGEIMVSEIGFGRSEVAILDTELLFKQWYQLLNAVNHLFDQM